MIFGLLGDDLARLIFDLELRFGGLAARLAHILVALAFAPGDDGLRLGGQRLPRLGIVLAP
jgi:hypothetical protein